MKDLILKDLREAQDELERFLAEPSTLDSIARAAEICSAALKAGCKIISCGNGGSLCDATHFAEELTGRFRDSRSPLPAMAINDPAHITCTTNDYSFEKIFSRVVEALGRPGDVLCGFSTSGTSKNVVEAARLAREKGMTARELAQAIHPHPTMSEGVMEALEAVHGEAIHG